MSRGPSRFRTVVVTLYFVALHAAVIYLAGERLLRGHASPPVEPTTQVTNTPTEPPSPAADPRPSAFEVPEAKRTPDTTSVDEADDNAIIVPVQGVSPEQLTDTFEASRANGRPHDAIDIMAAAGTPVLAAVDGEIVKFFDSVPGGTTIYQLSRDRRFIYYYAHLQRRADDVKVGDTVRRGKVIAYVGDTGNAGAGNYHLHFSIAQAIDPARYWEGTYVNPYPYLISGSAPGVK